MDCGTIEPATFVSLPSVSASQEHSHRRPVTVRYGVHAERRLAERGISKADVEAVIADPEIVLPPKDKTKTNRTDLIKSIGGRRIHVVVEDWGAQDPVVITAYAPGAR